ncbi:MAG: class I SAM-dependent methyltransferase [Gammaproteobacteria bacterium]
MASGQELIAHQETLYASHNPTRRWLHCSRRDFILGCVNKYGPKRGGAAMEVGPGSGVYLPALASRFDKVVALDIEASYLENAKELTRAYPNIETVTCNITNCTLEPERFDLILCSEVVEHLSDSRAALREMHRLLQPGGVLVLSTPQRYSTLEIVAKIAFLPGIVHGVRWVYREPVLEMGHINLMTEAEVREQLEEAGFTVLEHHKSGLYLPLIAEFFGARALCAAQWLEKKIRGVALSWMLWTQYYVAGRK